MDDVRPQQLPREFPGVATHHVVEGLRVVGEALVASRLRHATDAPQLRCVREEIHLGPVLRVRAMRDPELLHGFRLRREGVVDHPAPILGTAGGFVHVGPEARPGVLHGVGHARALVDVARTRDHPVDVDQQVRPAREVRELGRSVAHFLRCVRRLERPGFGGRVRHLAVARRVGAGVEERTVVGRHLRDRAPGLLLCPGVAGDEKGAGEQHAPHPAGGSFRIHT